MSCNHLPVSDFGLRKVCSSIHFLLSGACCLSDWFCKLNIVQSILEFSMWCNWKGDVIFRTWLIQTQPQNLLELWQKTCVWQKIINSNRFWRLLLIRNSPFQMINDWKHIQTAADGLSQNNTVIFKIKPNPLIYDINFLVEIQLHTFTPQNIHDNIIKTYRPISLYMFVLNWIRGN